MQHPLLVGTFLSLLLGATRAIFTHKPSSSDFSDSQENLCKRDLLDLLGMKGTKMSIPRMASPMEKSFCRRNRQTCCDINNIQSIASTFSRAARTFRRKFELVEEMLTLFRGPKFMSLMAQVRRAPECSDRVESLSVQVKGVEHFFFEDVYAKSLLDRVNNFLTDLNFYRKNVTWFHGDLVCTMCNPQFQRFFDISDNYSMLFFNSNNCLEIFEEKQFELRLMQLYNDFLLPVTDALKCAFPDRIEHLASSQYFSQEQIDELKREEKLRRKIRRTFEDPSRLIGYNWESKNRVGSELVNSREDFEEIEPISAEIIDNRAKLARMCKKDLEVSTSECRNYCTKPLRFLDSPSPNMFRGLQSMYSILFFLIVGRPVEEFYPSNKGFQWVLGEFDARIEFFDFDIAVNEYHFDSIKWMFSPNKGVNLFREIISKKFIESFISSAPLLFWSAALALLVSLINI